MSKQANADVVQDKRCPDAALPAGTGGCLAVVHLCVLSANFGLPSFMFANQAGLRVREKISLHTEKN